MGVINPMLNHNTTEWSAERPVVVEGEHRGQSKTLWGFVLLLAVGLGALGYYGYQAVKSQDSEISKLFGTQGTVTTLGQRADAVENKLQGMAGDWQAIGDRVTNLEGKVTANARQTRLYAETLTQQLHRQITAEMDARTSPLDARLQQVETEEANQRSQMSQIAQMESNLKQEIAGAREENGRDLSAVREQQESTARNLGALSQKLDRQRIDFEMSKGESRELAPGIELRIRGMNPAYQRYHGSLFLVQDHRTVWLKDQSVNEPVRVFHRDGGEPYELVITDVTKKAVAGYLLAPMKPGAAAAGTQVGQRSDGSNSAVQE